jgi:cytoskeletal protein CcmA (bactofilin family)
MFRSKKISELSFNSVVSGGCRLTGDLEFTKTLLIDELAYVSGKLLGHTDSEQGKNVSTLIVRNNSTIISPRIEADTIKIDSTVSSDIIWCERELVIGPNARIENSVIYYRSMSIEIGAMLINCQLKHLDYCSEGETV